MSSPPLYTSVPSTDPSEVPTQPSEPPLPAFDHSDMDAKRPRIPLYPLLILFLHLLIALRLFPISETIYLLLFIFFSVTLSLLHDQLVFLFARPATTLDFWRERWKAVNTQLAGVFIAGGFLAVPKDGDWSDARTAFTILGGFLVVIAAVILNAAHNQLCKEEIVKRDSQVAVELPVIADLAEEGVENEVLFDGDARASEDLEAQLGSSK